MTASIIRLWSGKEGGRQAAQEKVKGLKHRRHYFLRAFLQRVILWLVDKSLGLRLAVVEEEDDPPGVWGVRRGSWTQNGAEPCVTAESWACVVHRRLDVCRVSLNHVAVYAQFSDTSLLVTLCIAKLFRVT